MENCTSLDLFDFYLYMLRILFRKIFCGFLIVIVCVCVYFCVREQSIRYMETKTGLSGAKVHSGYVGTLQYTPAFEKPSAHAFGIEAFGMETSDVPHIRTKSSETTKPAAEIVPYTEITITESPVPESSVSDSSEAPSENLTEPDEIAFATAYPGFVLDTSGNLTSCCEAEDVVIDGLLVLPSHADCTGIEAGAFAGIEETITELFIPANITYIAPGALDSLTDLMYIQVLDGNPAFYSESGILYHMDGSPAALPKGRNITEG